MTISEFVNKVGFKVKEEDVKKVNDSITDIKDTATKLLGAIGIGFSLASINGLIEEFGRVNNQILNATSALGEQEEIQQKILASASKTRTTYQQSAQMISNLVQENSDLFATVDEAAKFNDAATMLFKAAGKTNEDVAGLMEAINKSFAKGVVDSETMSQLLERSPEAVQLLNQRLGTTSSQLEELASSGAMTVADLKAAFVDNYDVIEKKFGNVQYTITDGLTYIRNQWGLWLAQTDKTLGITNTIAKVMISAFNGVIAILTKVRTALVWLAEKLGGTENLMKAIALVAGSLFLAFNFSKIKSGFQTILGVLKIFKVQTLAIVAVVVLLALLVEDFINFVNGNDSLIGSFLEKAGIDSDEVREKFQGLGEQFKEIIGTVSQLGSTLLQSLVSVLGVVLEKIMNLVVDLLPLILDWLSKLIPVISRIIQSILPTVIKLINQLIPIVTQIIQTILPIIIDLINQLLPLVMQIIQTILPAVINLIKQLIPFVLQIIQSILPVVINLISAIIPLVTQIIQAILPVIIDLINQLIPLILQIIQSILPIVIELINMLIPIITQIIEAILPVVIELISTIIPLVMQIIEAILPVIIELLNTLIPVIAQIIESILPVIIELINTLLPIITQIVEAILPIILELVNAILPPLMQIVEAILPMITTLLEALLPVIQPIIDLISNLAETLLPIIQTIMKALIPIIEAISAVLKPVFDVIGLIVDAIGTVVGWIADGLGWIVDLFFGGDEDAAAVAEDVAAYADGSDYTEDTFIAGEEGPELITNQRGRKVFTALETGRIFDSMSSLANAKTASPQTAAVVTNSSEVKKSVVQNIEFHNEFNGDKAIQKDAAGAMDKSAEDVTAQLARGIALAT